jgi:plasmid stability protein
MASITIKSLPKQLHRDLKTRAARHQRSLNQEVIALLTECLVPSRPVDVEALVAEARQFRASFQLKTSAREIDALKKKGRR